MAPQQPIKALLLDIGGVCVASPLQAILEFEQSNGVPSDWVNFAISRSNPNGAWQRLERGEIKMDDAFFEAFNADLHNREAWHEFHSSYKNGEGKMKDAAMKNPSLLGDPVSFKNESADSEPTDQDRGAKSSSRTASAAKPSDSESSPPPDAPAPTPTSLTSSTSSPKRSTSPTPSQSEPPLPPLPTVDGKALFWQMMEHARTPDPYIFPALLRIKSAPASQRPILAALSNTVIFPPDHPYNRLPSIPASSSSTPSSPSSSPSSQSSVSSDSDPRTHFDVFVASAEVGMRKPEERIYQYAIQKLDEFSKGKGGEGIKPKEVLLLDDLGINLKTAREMGMQTIKVQLGKTHRAVKELERATGLELMDEKTRRSKL